MEELGLNEIREAEKFLELEYAEGCQIAAGRDLQTTRDLWEETKHREHSEQLVRFASEVNRSGSSLDSYGKFKNEAIRFGSAVMVAGKRRGTEWIVIVGAGGVYEGIFVAFFCPGTFLDTNLIRLNPFQKD